MPESEISRLPAPVTGSVRDLLDTPRVRRRFEEALGSRFPQFIASLANLVYATPDLNDCNLDSIIAASLVAASLDLAIDRNLGFAYIVPYFDNKRREKMAQFQMGYKGYIQLALRTGLYRTLHCTEVYKGEVLGVNRFTGEIERGVRESDEVVGYLAYLKLLNGFEKTLYMTVAEIRAHGSQYSKNYGNEKSLWQTKFPVMALKTVTRLLLMKWGLLSIEILEAIKHESPPDDSASEPDDESDPNNNHRESDKMAVFGEGEPAQSTPVETVIIEGKAKPANEKIGAHVVSSHWFDTNVRKHKYFQHLKHFKAHLLDHFGLQSEINLTYGMLHALIEHINGRPADEKYYPPDKEKFDSDKDTKVPDDLGARLEKCGLTPLYESWKKEYNLPSPVESQKLFDILSNLCEGVEKKVFDLGATQDSEFGPLGVGRIFVEAWKLE